MLNRLVNLQVAGTHKPQLDRAPQVPNAFDALLPHTLSWLFRCGSLPDPEPAP